tara:strand:+ start:906 stop:2090 length:1185 start_codon:yes stop_codon:yes gene_type:complete
MKIVKLISFLLLLSSCNQYLGTVEPDYIPQNDVKEVFLNKTRTIESNDEFKLDEVFYPYNKKFNFKKPLDFIKITSVDKKSQFLFLDNEIYYSKKNNIYSINKKDYKKNNSFEVEIDKNEEIILISFFNNNIYILTNKGKVFKSLQNGYEIILDLQVFLSQNTISQTSKIIAFSVFGDIIEINLENNSFVKTGDFAVNHGITNPSNTYSYENNNVILYNSGTLIFLKQRDNTPETNYFLEDLNILSRVGIFEEFLDTPFNVDNFFYFVEKKGLISVFNPITSEILWETDISSSVIDFFIDKNKNLLILTFNKIYIYTPQGYLQKEIAHNQENPFNFWTDGKNLYLANQDGISIVNFNGEIIESIKQKFTDFLKIFENNNQYYFIDSRNLYTLSE